LSSRWHSTFDSAHKALTVVNGFITSLRPIPNLVTAITDNAGCQAENVQMATVFPLANGIHYDFADGSTPQNQYPKQPSRLQKPFTIKR